MTMVSAASSSVVWYVAFGAAHEAAHVAAAAIFGRLDGAGSYLNVARALFGRHVHLPSLAAPDCPRWQIDFVQHFAWVCSVTLAAAAFALTRTKIKRNGDDKTFEGLRSEAVGAMVLAALVTALEAIGSDLLRFRPTGAMEQPPYHDLGDKVSDASLFFCGNFGEDKGEGAPGGERRGTMNKTLNEAILPPRTGLVT